MDRGVSLIYFIRTMLVKWTDSELSSHTTLTLANGLLTIFVGSIYYELLKMCLCRPKPTLFGLHSCMIFFCSISKVNPWMEGWDGDWPFTVNNIPPEWTTTVWIRERMESTLLKSCWEMSEQLIENNDICQLNSLIISSKATVAEWSSNYQWLGKNYPWPSVS